MTFIFFVQIWGIKYAARFLLKDRKLNYCKIMTFFYWDRVRIIKILDCPRNILWPLINSSITVWEDKNESTNYFCLTQKPVFVWSITVFLNKLSNFPNPQCNLQTNKILFCTLSKLTLNRKTGVKTENIVAILIFNGDECFTLTLSGYLTKIMAVRTQNQTVDKWWFQITI